MIFRCPECGGHFEDSELECCVGGHWTPHSESDKRPNDFSHCCHQHQREVVEQKKA
jgi:hypothetical protein